MTSHDEIALNSPPSQEPEVSEADELSDQEDDGIENKLSTILKRGWKPFSQIHPETNVFLSHNQLHIISKF